MDFIDEIKALSLKIPNSGENIKTEEATKNAQDYDSETRRAEDIILDRFELFRDMIMKGFHMNGEDYDFLEDMTETEKKTIVSIAEFCFLSKENDNRIGKLFQMYIDSGDEEVVT